VDIVYICRPGDNEELRYSIRSAIKNLTHDNLWVVGQKPDWYTGNFIKMPIHRSKQESARLNLQKICESNEISDDFVLMNDDFYIIKKINYIDYFYDKTLLEKTEDHETKYPKNAYTNLLCHTYDKLISLDVKNPLNYEIHVPMIMKKSLLENVLKYKTCLWRSMYGNLYNVGGTQMADVKVYNPNSGRDTFNYMDKSHTFLSTTDNYFEPVINNLLSKKFSNPSPYESKDL